jgi:hypothetical protein
MTCAFAIGGRAASEAIKTKHEDRNTRPNRTCNFPLLDQMLK